jgi:IclR family pca regulon transcriptional regulator
MLHEDKLISLYRREVPNLIFLRLPLVMKDLHARAMGKAILANMNNEDLSAFLKNINLRKLTPNTIVDPKVLLKDLEVSKGRGYSINNEEYVKGLICIGAPVINYNTNNVKGAVSLDFPASEYSLEIIEGNYTGILTKLASELSEMFTISDI